MGTRKRRPPKLQWTEELDIFEMHELNRPINEGTHKDLLRSMQKYGFLSAYPMHCTRLPNGKFSVISGHHRLHFAKRLKLGVYFQVCNIQVEPSDMAGSGESWTVSDWVHARANGGDDACRFVLRVVKKHRIPMNAALSLCGGESPSGGNKRKYVKTGSFRLAPPDLLQKVIGVMNAFLSAKFCYARTASFLKAIASAVLIPEIDVKRLVRNASQYGGIVAAKRTKEDYLAELEQIYNRHSKAGQLPLKFRASQVAKARARTFGRENGALPEKS